jgi:hypothetical protein
LSEDTLNLLKDQRDAMESYIDALQKRIDSAEDTERCKETLLVVQRQYFNLRSILRAAIEAAG